MDGLFALGSNGSGQLGIGHKEDVSVPKQVEFLGSAPSADIVQIAAGGNHTVILTEAGRAYWAGDASSGACGVANDSAGEAEAIKFRELVISASERLRPITHIACTWDSSVFALKDGSGKTTQVYTCGPADMQEASTDSDRTARTSVLLSEFPPPGTQIVSLAAGFRHVIAVLDNGDVYGWGNGRKGQLGETDGIASSKGVIRHPRKIDGVGFRVSKAVCCQYSTCLIAEPGDGRILVLGADKWGLKSAAPVEVPNWDMISASWGGIYILQRSGALIAWGRDDHGQLPPLGLPDLEDIAAGSEHVVALTKDGEVISWGWGEHGNCGPQTEKFGDVKGRWNTLASLKHLPEGSKIKAIAAGCATSWINIAIEDGLLL